mmetsp:Transcript_97120/g.313012  ORF Transcript_97120/g.313012 Transcript_97120/m.313012 type:complete len:202 (+) Transcript_97120:387-992(+)
MQCGVLQYVRRACQWARSFSTTGIQWALGQAADVKPASKFLGATHVNGSAALRKSPTARLGTRGRTPWSMPPRRRPLRLASARRTIRNGHRRRGTSPSASSSTWVRRMAIPSMRSFPTATALCCNFSSIGALLATFRAIGSAMSASTLECMIFCLTFVFCFRHLASLFEILVRVHTYCASGNACLLVCVCVCSHCDYNAHT